ILQRIVSESARERPGQRAVLSRMTEVLFVDVLRSWISSLGAGEGGWLGAMADPHIGKALRLMHEQPHRPWTLRDRGSCVGLGRAAFSARFTKLVGQPMHRYLIARRMQEAAFLLESSDEGIARIAGRVGYETAAAFSKSFHRHQGMSPGRYRAARKSDNAKEFVQTPVLCFRYPKIWCRDAVQPDGACPFLAARANRLWSRYVRKTGGIHAAFQRAFWKATFDSSIPTYPLAEIGRGWSKTSRPIQLVLA